MNRKKKVNTTLKAKAKKANAKLNPGKIKPKYISKAERASLPAEDNNPSNKGT
jgi:hypothetical protein